MILLGVGHVGRALARVAPGSHGTTRSIERAPLLTSWGVTPHVIGDDVSSLAPLTDGRDVVVTFPPDGATDARWAGVCRARHVVYVSSTGVYGSGHVDEQTTVDTTAPRAARRLDAEHAWRDRGASVVRAAAIYGPGFGLHQRVRAGIHRIPGDGSNVISRVHVDDLAMIIVAALTRRAEGHVYLAADASPAAHVDVVRFAATSLGVPMPPSAPLEEVAETLRGSRVVDASASLRALSIALSYPSYREGIAACLDAERTAPNA